MRAAPTITSSAGIIPIEKLDKDIDATPGSVGTLVAKTATSVNGWAVDVTSPEGRITAPRRP